MGILRSLAKGVLSVTEPLARSMNDSALIVTMFQEHRGFAQLAFKTFQRCADDRGIVVDEKLIDEAMNECVKYPKLTMGQFLDSRLNKRMYDNLR